MAPYWTHPEGTAYPDALEMFRRLHGHVRLAVVANQEATTVDALTRDGFAPYVDVWGISAVVGHEKPSRAFFDWALRECGTTPERTVHIGNRLDTDVRPAKAIGIGTIWVLRGEAPPQPTPEQLAEPDLVGPRPHHGCRRHSRAHGPMTAVTLGIDLATASARCVALDTTTGSTLARADSPLPPPDRRPGGVSRQASTYAPTALELVRRVCRQLGPDAARVAAVSVTGTSGTVVPVDAAGGAVGAARLYDDSSGEQQMAGLGVTGAPSIGRMLVLRREHPGARWASTADVVNAALAAWPGGAPTPRTGSRPASTCRPARGRWRR